MRCGLLDDVHVALGDGGVPQYRAAVVEGANASPDS
jgi:hypothetical protein